MYFMDFEFGTSLSISILLTFIDFGKLETITLVCYNAKHPDIQKNVGMPLYVYLWRIIRPSSYR